MTTPSDEPQSDSWFALDSDGLPVPTEAWWSGPGRANEPQFDSPLYRKCDDEKCEYRYAFAEYGLPHYHYLGAGPPEPKEGP